MRRTDSGVGWIAFWAFLAAIVLGCGGVDINSLQWTTAVPATADLVGEWRPSESMEATLREEWEVPAAPLRLVLAEDGTADVDGFDLLYPDTPEWRAAQDALRAGAAPRTARGTWRVEGTPGGYQGVTLTVGDQDQWLRLWGLSPPYSLSAVRDVSDPEQTGYLFFVRPADEARRSAFAPTTDAKRDPTAGDGFLEIAVTLVFWTALLLLAVIVVVLAAVVVAVAIVAAITLVVAVVAAIAAGGALGIAATSAIVGLARRSLSAGFRTFVTLAAAVPGSAVGAAAGWALRRIVRGPTPGTSIVVDVWILAGLLVGALAGGLVGRFAAIAVERLARWAMARFDCGARTPAA